MSAKAVGSVTLSFEDRTLNLNNVYFVSTFGKNLISVARLLEQDYCLKFIKNGIRISFPDNSFVTDACMKNALFYIYPTQPSLLDTEIDNDLIREPKRIKLSESSDLTKSTYLWHLRLGHISLDRINRLVRDGPL